MDVKIPISVAIRLSRIREWLGRPAVRKAQRERALNTLVLLRDVGVHMLENRPAPRAPEADHVRQWSENLDWWCREVERTLPVAGASTIEVSRFSVLGDVSGGTLAQEKRRRQDRILGSLDSRTEGKG